MSNLDFVWTSYTPRTLTSAGTNPTGTPWQQLQAAVWGYSGTGGRTLTSTPAVITSQPSPTRTGTEGGNAAFIFSASGIVTAGWQSKANGASTYTNITGATSPTYIRSNLTLADSGTMFRGFATGADGVTVYTNEVTLTVIASGTGTSTLVFQPVTLPLRSSNLTTFELVAGDTAPARLVKLVDDNDYPLQLPTGTIVQYIAKSVVRPGSSATPVPMNVLCDIVNGNTGEVQYTWDDPVPDAGTYQEMFKVTFPGGKVLHIPGTTFTVYAPLEA